MVFAAFLPFVLAQGARVSPGAAVCSQARRSDLRGVVVDPTGALIPGATVRLGSVAAVSGADGSFRLACVHDGTQTLKVQAEGFAESTTEVAVPVKDRVRVTLVPAAVQTQVEVNADTVDTAEPGRRISGDRLQTLADDPDDLLRELQQLGAMAGGNPANTLITVNGFQGAAKLPPKDAIAYIEINPDQYSAEYVYPPFSGGRVNVYTKAGQKVFHGALFATNGSPWENARDPFSPAKAPLGKQRYGFELTGPVRRGRSDFALDLEHRAIANYAVVNAVTLDAAGDPVNTVANVATPQSLWEGEARVAWRLGSRNNLVASYSANVNGLQNVGVGGNVLPESGYNSDAYDSVVRLMDLTTVSTHLMHEARVALRWDGEQDTPLSAAPKVNVAGSFTGGGAVIGAQRLREFNLEADDDTILSAGRHTLKVGTEFMLFAENHRLTPNFNGTYLFGGGSAPVLDGSGQAVPGATETITGIEQYRRGLLRLPGGAPTVFSNVAGDPRVRFTQVQDAVYAQDDFNVGHEVHLQGGLRYALQNAPTVLNTLTPRFGVLWSPKRSRLTLHARVGLFATTFPATDEAEVMRADGVHRITSMVYDPVYGDPFSTGTVIRTARRFSPHIANVNNVSQEEGLAYDLGWGFHVDASYSSNRMWNDLRTKNINAPLNGLPTGPRALGIPNLNLLEMQNSAQNRGNAQQFNVTYSGAPWLQVYAGVVRVRVTTDADADHFHVPQSSFSDAGEFAQSSGAPVWMMWGGFWMKLPRRIVLSADYSANGDAHYNLTTGFDNNGDGNFNDRPEYAAPGSPRAVATPFGLLTATGGVGVLRWNEGALPWRFYVDPNVQKTFVLSRDPKAEHPPRITLNLRSANVLNHTNVTQQGGVLGSPLFGRPYAADMGRRVEAGIRYSF